MSPFARSAGEVLGGAAVEAVVTVVTLAEGAALAEADALAVLEALPGVAGAGLLPPDSHAHASAAVEATIRANEARGASVR
jgi:hypothetical protein